MDPLSYLGIYKMGLRSSWHSVAGETGDMTHECTFCGDGHSVTGPFILLSKYSRSYRLQG